MTGEMPVNFGSNESCRFSVCESEDAIGILNDEQIAFMIENYVAAERLTAMADYGHYHGDLFFADATELEMGLVGIARGLAGPRRRKPAGGPAELLPLRVDGPRHLERLGPITARELAT
jgi:hypothetical protein